jgi:hypothetical protein
MLKLYTSIIVGLLSLSENSASSWGGCSSSLGIATRENLQPTSLAAVATAHQKQVFQPKGRFADEIIASMQAFSGSPESIKRLNLKNKPFLFTGDVESFEVEKAQRIIELISQFKNLELIDFSDGGMSQDGLSFFAPLLLRENLKYFVILCTNGADTLDAIRELVLALQNELQSQDLKSSEMQQKVDGVLRKVIWIPEGSLDRASQQLPATTIQAHRDYFSYRKTQ